jgi:fructose/tagatose bisphosphate aldolase
VEFVLGTSVALESYTTHVSLRLDLDKRFKIQNQENKRSTKQTKDLHSFALGTMHGAYFKLLHY